MVRLRSTSRTNKIKVTSKLQKNCRGRRGGTFRAIYKELYKQLTIRCSQTAWSRVPGYRKNYAPHFTEGQAGHANFRAFATDSAGARTARSIFLLTLPALQMIPQPGKKWFGNLLQRNGELTDYDAVAGL